MYTNLENVITFTYVIGFQRNWMRWNRGDEAYAYELVWSESGAVEISAILERPFRFKKNESSTVVSGELILTLSGIL